MSLQTLKIQLLALSYCLRYCQLSEKLGFVSGHRFSDAV